MRRHRRHSKQEGGGGVALGLIITPMLDMAFQLLAFFVMTYHPSALEGHIDGKLLPPEKIATKGKKAPDPAMAQMPPADIPPEVSDVVLVFVKAVPKGQIEGGREDGEPRWVEIRRKESPAPLTLSGDVNARDLDHFVKSLEKELTAELKPILEEPSASDAAI